MFLHLSVSHSVHRGVCAPLGRHPSKANIPWEDTPWADIPLARNPPRQPPWPDTPILLGSNPLARQPLLLGRHPLGRHSLLDRHSPPKISTEAGGTHPSGMHSCSTCVCFFSCQLWKAKFHSGRILFCERIELTELAAIEIRKT